MKSIVITGSASGIGLGLAKVFLQRGHRVVISDLNHEELNLAQAELATLASADNLKVKACDVTDHAQLQQLWDFSVQSFGRVDVWYNNAGTGSDNSNIIDTDIAILDRVLKVNVHGVVMGTQVAMQGMRAQGGGEIYNMSGFGGEGTIRPGMVIYGTSKRAVAYFSKAVAKEQQGSDIKIAWVNPGMVLTPLVINEARDMDPERWAMGRKIFNLFGETVETTTEKLVDRILENPRNGRQIHLLPMRKILWRFLSSLVKKRDVVSQFGI